MKASPTGTPSLEMKVEERNSSVSPKSSVDSTQDVVLVAFSAQAYTQLVRRSTETGRTVAQLLAEAIDYVLRR